MAKQANTSHLKKLRCVAGSDKLITKQVKLLHALYEKQENIIQFEAFQTRHAQLTRDLKDFF